MISAVPGDCEVVGGWLFDQPVNTWSSFSFVVVGVVIAWITLRHGHSRWFLLLALASVVEGIGSVLFHGGATRGGHFVHDFGLFAIAAFMASWQTARAAGASPSSRSRWVGLGVAGALAIASPLWWITSDSTNVIVAVLVVAVVASDLIARRRGLGAVWSPALVVATAVAIGAWFLGRTDSPLCTPSSALQPHAVWHVLSALVVLGWFDRALDADDPVGAPRLYRRGIDRGVGLIAKGLVKTFHRSVQTIGGPLPGNRPVLIVANHGNGFVDPVVVAAAIGRMPRFMAKAALWKVPVAAPLLNFVGALPVYRRSDGDDVSNNRSVFAACHEELARGATVAIFPEGTTGDRAALDRVRSGAARIALGSVDGAPGLAIVPIGLAFESRYETRTRAVVEFGEPIEVAEHRRHDDGPDGEPDHDDVSRLTTIIAEALSDVSPQFHTVDERDVFRSTGRIVTSDETRIIGSFADCESVARRLGRASDTARERVLDAYDRYARRLTAADLVDRDVASGSIPMRRLVLSVIALLLAGSVLTAATLIHLPALLLVVGATSAVHATATKGTVRALVGFVAGIATWLIAGVVIADGWAALLAAAVVALCGVAALFVWSPFATAVRTVIARLRCRARGSGIEELFDTRRQLVSTATDVVEELDESGRPDAPVAP